MFWLWIIISFIVGLIIGSILGFLLICIMVSSSFNDYGCEECCGKYCKKEEQENKTDEEN